AYSLTHDAGTLGQITLLQLAPTILLCMPAGLVAARWDRRKSLIALELLEAVPAAWLMFLAATGHLHVWHLIVARLWLGLCMPFEFAVRFHLVTDIAHADYLEEVQALSLSRAVCIHSMSLGPAID